MNPMKEPLPAPTACPFCASAKIANPGEKANNASAYWRCEACGELWNVARLRTRQSRQNFPPGQRSWGL
jgi:transcription elongation factor Elf1